MFQSRQNLAVSAAIFTKPVTSRTRPSCAAKRALRHEPTFFCFSFVKSEATWLRSEEIQFEAKKQNQKQKKQNKKVLLFFFLLYFLQVYCPSGISPMGNSGCLPRGRPAATESRYPTYSAYLMFSCFHNPTNSDMYYGIFNVRLDVNACDCRRGCTNTVRESALKVDWEKNLLPHRAIEPVSAVCRSDALPTELHPHPAVPTVA